MPPTKLVKQLVDERRARGLKVGDVADRAGYSVDHLMKAECGNRNPGLGALTAWAETLGFELVLRRKEKLNGQ